MILTGCGEYHMTYTFNDDGSISAEQDVKITDLVKRLDPNAMKNARDLISKDFNITQKNNNEYVGNKVFPNISSVVNSNPKIWSPDENYDGVQLRKGFLYDYYALDLHIKKQKKLDLNFDYKPQMSGYFSMDNKINSGMAYYEKSRQAQDDADEINNMANTVAQSAIDSAKADLTIHLPYKADNSNASSLTDDGKTLTWDMKPYALGDEAFNVNAKFRIYHKNVLVALAVIAGILAITAICMIVFAVIKRKKIRVRNYFIGSAVLIVLFLVGSSIYIKNLMANPPRLTVQDRIIADDAKDSAGRPLGDTLKKIAAASENPLDKVRNILREKDIDGTIIASSVVDDNGFLALLNDKKYVFAVYSAIDDTVAIIPYPSKEKMLYHNPWDILNFRASKYYYTRNGITERTIRFSMSKKMIVKLMEIIN